MSIDLNDPPDDDLDRETLKQLSELDHPAAPVFEAVYDIEFGEDSS